MSFRGKSSRGWQGRPTWTAQLPATAQSRIPCVLNLLLLRWREDSARPLDPTPVPPCRGRSAPSGRLRAFKLRLQQLARIAEVFEGRRLHALKLRLPRLAIVGYKPAGHHTPRKLAADEAVI